MNKSDVKRSLSICSLLLGIFCYAMQRVIPLFLEPTRQLVLIQAIVFTALTGIIYILIIKSNDVMMGIVSAIFAYKVVPPHINGLEEFTKTGGILYYLVGRVAVVLLLAAIVKLYYSQDKPREIKPLPILLLILLIPFMNEISSKLSYFADDMANGNAIYAYFISFAFYITTMLIFLFAATKTNEQSAMMIIDYSLVSSGVRTVSKTCAIIVKAAAGAHISKSLFCWVAIYVFVFSAFMIMRKTKVKKNQALV